jgi:hypothetical protein
MPPHPDFSKVARNLLRNGPLSQRMRAREPLRFSCQTNAALPVIARPTMSVFISLVPSYE